MAGELQERGASRVGGWEGVLGGVSRDEAPS